MNCRNNCDHKNTLTSVLHSLKDDYDDGCIDDRIAPVMLTKAVTNFLTRVESKRREFKAKQVWKDKFNVVLDDILYSYPNGIKYQDLLTNWA